MIKKICAAVVCLTMAAYYVLSCAVTCLLIVSEHYWTALGFALIMVPCVHVVRTKGDEMLDVLI